MALGGGGSRRKKKAREQAAFAERIKRLGPVPFAIKKTPQYIRFSRRIDRSDRFRGEYDAADFRFYLTTAKAALKAGDCRLAKAAHDEAQGAMALSMRGAVYKKAQGMLDTLEKKIASCKVPKKRKRPLH